MLFSIAAGNLEEILLKENFIEKVEPFDINSHFFTGLFTAGFGYLSYLDSMGWSISQKDGVAPGLFELIDSPRFYRIADSATQIAVGTVAHYHYNSENAEFRHDAMYFMGEPYSLLDDVKHLCSFLRTGGHHLDPLTDAETAAQYLEKTFSEKR